MNVFDKILICAFLLSILVWQALHQAYLFKQQKTISHLWKTIWYSLAVALATAPFVLLYDWWCILKVPIIGISERMALFDMILSLARHKGLFYNGEGSTGSIIDRLENRLSNIWIKVLKIIYILLFILALIFIK